MDTPHETLFVEYVPRQMPSWGRKMPETRHQHRLDVAMSDHTSATEEVTIPATEEMTSILQLRSFLLWLVQAWCRDKILMNSNNVNMPIINRFKLFCLILEGSHCSRGLDISWFLGHHWGPCVYPGRLCCAPEGKPCLCTRPILPACSWALTIQSGTKDKHTPRSKKKFLIRPIGCFFLRRKTNCIYHCTCHHLTFYTHMHRHTDVAHTHIRKAAVLTPTLVPGVPPQELKHECHHFRPYFSCWELLQRGCLCLSHRQRCPAPSFQPLL